MKVYNEGNRPRIVKSHEATSTLTGRVVTALVSAFGNVDYQGDRVMPGSFTKSLQRYRDGGRSIPIVWSHAWSDPWAHIGTADPFRARETDRGLELEVELDVDDNPTARQVAKLLRDGRVREWSFAYDVFREEQSKDGANNLIELNIWEAGPTLKGANSETGTLAVVKSANMTMTDANANIAGERPTDGEMPVPSRLQAHLLAWHGKRASALAGRTAAELSAIHAVEHAVPRDHGMSDLRGVDLPTPAFASSRGGDAKTSPAYWAAKIEDLLEGRLDG